MRHESRFRSISIWSVLRERINVNEPNTQRWPAPGRREIGKYVVWVTKDGLSISFAGEGAPSVDVRFSPVQTLELLRHMQFMRDVIGK